MKRLALTALLAAALVAPASAGATNHPHPTHGIGTAVLKYNWRGGHATSAAPGHCSWQLNGLEVDEWICLCSRVEWSDGVREIVCQWHLTSTTDEARPVRANVKPRTHQRVVRMYAVPAVVA